jgi:hypothetical protein
MKNIIANITIMKRIAGLILLLEDEEIDVCSEFFWLVLEL